MRSKHISFLVHADDTENTKVQIMFLLKKKSIHKNRSYHLVEKLNK